MLSKSSKRSSTRSSGRYATVEAEHVFASRRFGDKNPVTIKLGPSKAYLLLQPETYGSLLKDTRSCSNKAFAVLVMEQMFGTPKSAMRK